MALTTSNERILKFMDLISIGIGSSFGIGVFVLLGEITKNIVGSAVIVSIILSGVAALLAGFSFAEFGIRFLKADSSYVYCYSRHSENVSFLFGWALLLEFIAGTGSVAKGIIVFIDALAEKRISHFLRKTFPLNWDYGFVYFDPFSPIIILLVSLPLALGIKDSRVARNIFTAFSVILLICIIVMGSFKADLKNWNVDTYEGPTERIFAPYGIQGVLKGAAISFYGFVGFDTVGISGSEVAEPQKYLPLAVLGAVIITLVEYAGAGAILTLVFPYEELDTGAALPFVFEKIYCSTLKWIIAVGAFLGFQMSLFGTITQLPRIVHSMASDGLLFHFLANIHSKYNTPVIATVMGGLTAATVSAFFSFQHLVNLTVIGSLLVSTVLAIDVIMLRYTSESETAEYSSEEKPALSSTGASMAQIMRHFFTRSNSSTKLTKKVVLINLILICASSMILASLFMAIHQSIKEAAFEVILPVVILFIISLLSVISIACQTRSLIILPFKVPLIPFLPCLSIFLNIFLMIFLGPTTLVFFAIWMAMGFLPHLMLNGIKYCRGESGANSLFEINKLNSVKLNELIWKMQSEKKSFYEGAVNPVFENESEIRVDEEVIDNGEKKVQNYTEIREPISSESLVNEMENAKPEVINEKAKIVEHLPVRCETVHWECIAEIHTKDEFLQESYELEIVDNTYNFLSQIIEEMPKDDMPPLNEIVLHKPLDLVNEAEASAELDTRKLYPKTIPGVSVSDGRISNEDETILKKQKKEIQENEFINDYISNSNVAHLKEATLNVNDDFDITTNKVTEINSEREFEENSTDIRKCLKDVEKSDASDNTSTLHNNSNTVMYSKISRSKIDKKIYNDDESVSDIDSTEKTEKEKSVERRKIKNFKEKLNLLLKNKINTNNILREDSLIVDGNYEENNIQLEGVHNNIKTLNKSQIKNKLEFLLAKGPPKRCSLTNSFNIKIKEVNTNDVPTTNY